MAGICGNSRQGAFSIALSCLYKDDEDGGDVMCVYRPVALIVSNHQQHLHWLGWQGTLDEYFPPETRTLL